MAHGEGETERLVFSGSPLYRSKDLEEVIDSSRKKESFYKWKAKTPVWQCRKIGTFVSSSSLLLSLYLSPFHLVNFSDLGGLCYMM